MRPQPTDRTPAVVIVDRAWQSFEQLAAAARRDGARVLYVGVGLHRHSARMRDVVFDAVFLPDLDDIAVLAGILRDAAPVADIQCTEPDLPAVLAAASEAGVAGHVVAALAGRLPFVDKVEAAALLTEWGLPVPRSLPAGTDPAEVERVLGRDVVVKGVHGAGGLAVAFASGSDEIAAAATRLRAETGDDIYFEERLVGRNINYAAVHSGGRVVVECCFDSVRSHDDHRLPGTALQIVDDERVLAIGREVAARLSGTGIIDLEVMTTPDRVGVIDTNLRPFGSLVALRRAGVDLVGAYVAALAGRPFTAAPVDDAVRPSVFPTSSEKLLDVGLAPALRDYARSLPAAVRDFGAPYAAMASLSFGTRSARRASRSARVGAEAVARRVRGVGQRVTGQRFQSWR